MARRTRIHNRVHASAIIAASTSTLNVIATAAENPLRRA
jgi:hypothetical protein